MLTMERNRLRPARKSIKRDLKKSIEWLERRIGSTDQEIDGMLRERGTGETRWNCSSPFRESRV
jgi:hypothetical protein